ncbi:MAG TPA: Xaa-Pro peptidase family protein [Candidatus Omnitrophota bacterium]|nr:Xaa-Pro peptidase family protein [Candidatus Omnitrophota bacterium]HQJ15942.1 Xaa-Pro peptidase family protein [Candidatus Omnitrophota bacterium]
MNSRIKKLQSKLAKLPLDGLLVTDPHNISYLADYKCRDGYLLVTPDHALYITDGRYIQEMKRNLSGFRIIDIKPSFSDVLERLCKGSKISRLGFEDTHMTHGFYRKLSHALSARLVPRSGIIEAFREVKDAGEIGKIRSATRIAVKAYGYIKDIIKPGIKEIELAGEIERFIRFEGASCASFDIIVASGPNSALPHYQTGERKLQAAEAVLIDMGVEYRGYKSDLTRVFFVGKINTLVNRVYGIVRSAQAKALAAIRPGTLISSIDRAARGYISSSGFGKYFVHSLGHGVGIEVHEAPSISAKVERVLRPGQVFTIEPGIYIPGKFGIRIEDMVLVTNKGCEVLSGSLNK